MHVYVFCHVQKYYSQLYSGIQDMQKDPGLHRIRRHLASMLHAAVSLATPQGLRMHRLETWLILAEPRGSKYQIFKVSGAKYHQDYGFWSQIETSDIGYLRLWATYKAAKMRYILLVKYEP